MMHAEDSQSPEWPKTLDFALIRPAALRLLIVEHRESRSLWTDVEAISPEYCLETCLSH